MGSVASCDKASTACGYAQMTIEHLFQINVYRVMMVRDTEEKESKQGSAIGRIVSDDARDISEKVIDEGKDKLFKEQNKTEIKKIKNKINYKNYKQFFYLTNIKKNKKIQNSKMIM